MFPERLKQLRKEKGLTQVTLAETLGVSKGTVAMWETGKRMPGFDMLARLSELFDKRVDYIIGTSEDHRSATLIEEEVAQLGEWAVEEDYEDMLRKYALLDEYGLCYLVKKAKENANSEETMTPYKTPVRHVRTMLSER